MTSDFWVGFWVWLIALGIPASLFPLGFVWSWNPQVSGRYGHEHLRWFKRSVVFNLCSWVVTGSLLLAGITYFSDLHAQLELAMRREVTTKFETELVQFHAMTSMITRLEESAQSAEHALTTWFDRVDHVR